MESKDKLYNQLFKDVKRANQRILRLERLTGFKGAFATKQLYDYLDTFGITPKGRVRVNKGMNLKEMKIIQKAVKEFLGSELSTVKGAKKYKGMLEKEVRDNLSWKHANVMFEAKKHWTWIFDYFTPSEFFAIFVWPARRNNWTRELWIERLGEAIKKRGSKIPDEDLRNDLIDLYRYFVEEYEE